MRTILNLIITFLALIIIQLFSASSAMAAGCHDYSMNMSKPETTSIHTNSQNHDVIVIDKLPTTNSKHSICGDNCNDCASKANCSSYNCFSSLYIPLETKFINIDTETKIIYPAYSILNILTFTSDLFRPPRI